MGDTTGSTRAKPIRRFTLFDAIVLIAATAVGIASMRRHVNTGHWTSFETPHGGWSALHLLEPLRVLIEVSFPILAAWTLAVVLLRLRRPRPRLRHLVLQPGSAACLVVTAGLTARGCDLFVSWLGSLAIYGQWWPALSLILTNLFTWNSEIPYGVAVVWGVLAWSRRGRPERSWIDRTGRVLGVAWIVSAAALWCVAVAELAQVLSPALSAPAPGTIPSPPIFPGALLPLPPPGSPPE